jgi:hypothetical protein
MAVAVARRGIGTSVSASAIPRKTAVPCRTVSRTPGRRFSCEMHGKGRINTLLTQIFQLEGMAWACRASATLRKKVLHLKKRWLDRRVYEYFAVHIAPWLNWGDPVLIYQMGKVGSSSIRNSLFRCPDPRTRLVLMSHEYFPIRNRDPDQISTDPEYRDILAREITHERHVYEQFPLRKRIGRRFRERFYAEMIYRSYVRSKHRLKVITLVREPVANNVSMFFQLLKRYMGTDFEPADYDTDELIDVFISRYMHSRPLTWLDAEIRTHFGIDVYSYPFPVEQGYTVITEGRTSLLVLRCELDDERKERAIAGFLGLDGFEIVRSNVRSEKPEGQKYQEFKQRIRIPPALLDRMYDSKYARHFYSEAERDHFRKRWSGGAGATE